MNPRPDLLETTMRRHDEADDDAVGRVVGRVLARLDDEPPGRRPALAAGLAASAVVAVSVASALALGPGGDARVLNPAASGGASRATSVPAVVNVPPPPTSEPAALLDPLTYVLELGERRPDGTVPSRLRVENRSGAVVVDPGCLALANFSYGVVPVDRPRAPLNGFVMTECGGPQRLPNGFGVSIDGPDFDARRLAPGRYLAVIDFGESRSTVLSVPLT